MAQADLQKDKPLVIATMSHRVDYDDGSGPRCEVRYDSAYRLGEDADRYVRIATIGARDGALVNLRDVPFLMEALNEALRLDEKVA